MLRRATFILAILTLPFLLGGCLGEMMELSCLFIPDSAHCYQSAATQQSDPYGCEKVEQPEQFKSAGSNPPRDKCYLMIAQNTGDYDVCKSIKGGMYSYTQEECISGIATDRVDPAGCKKLTGQALADCRAAVGSKVTSGTISDLDQEISDLEGDAIDDPDAKKRFDDLTKKRNDLLDIAPTGVKDQYTKTRVSDIMDAVDDDDVASSIRKEYIEYKNKNPGKSVDQLMGELKRIRDEQETVKRLDDAANQLVDQLKTTIGDYTDEKKQEAIDKITEEGWDWAKKTGGDKLKTQLAELEKMKGKYDKASERYNELSEKIQKIKAVYDEVAGIYNKVKDLNGQVARGEITQDRAQVIKGAVILGKGLEYATQYVPVFGSTVSTISKETFEVTIKLANQRAKRSTALDKCFEDPEHCDTDGISAY